MGSESEIEQGVLCRGIDQIHQLVKPFETQCWAHMLVVYREMEKEAAQFSNQVADSEREMFMIEADDKKFGVAVLSNTFLGNKSILSDHLETDSTVNVICFFFFCMKIYNVQLIGCIVLCVFFRSNKLVSISQTPDFQGVKHHILLIGMILNHTKQRILLICMYVMVVCFSLTLDRCLFLFV